DTHLEAQRLRRAGKLRAARDAAVVCAQAACPPLIAADCASWKGGLDDLVPSLSFEARGPDGRDTAEVRVVLDGQLLLERLDGKTHEVDPGTHTLSFEMAGRPAISQTVVVREGE